MSGGRDRDDEVIARRIVERVTGARLFRTDIAGAPQRSLDARLEYDDGRTGWMEVTSLGREWEYRLAAQLSGDQGRWPKPGRWSWIIQLDHPRELKRIRKIYARAIELCEEHGVGTIEQLPLAVIETDADLEWLWAESTASFFGVVLPPGVSDASTCVRVSMASSVSSWGRGRDGLVEQLNHELHRQPLSAHLDKLQIASGDEKHLFLHATQGGLGEGAFYDLIHFELDSPEGSPLSISPELPEAITHLWLHSGWGKRVTRWVKGSGWDHPRYRD